MMGRYLLVLTANDLGILRSAIRTAQEEGCGARSFNGLERMLVKIDNARRVSGPAWRALDYSIANSIQDEPESVLTSKAQIKAASDLWFWLAHKLDPKGVTAQSYKPEGGAQ